MSKSLFDRLGLKRKKAEDAPTPDVSRVVGGPRRLPPRATLDEDAPRRLDLDAWKRRDLDQLSESWTAAHENAGDAAALRAFRVAVHNLHGVSGAYGGEALTRLTGSLQSLLTASKNIQDDAALLNLHVQACRAAVFGGEGSEDMAERVCEALETQVKERLSDTEDSADL